MTDESLISKWIETSGGPLVMMEKCKMTAWTGIGDTYPSPPGTVSHYDLACGVDGYIGSISIEGSQAVVLGDDPMQTSWMQLCENDGIIIRWNFAESKEQVEKLVITMPLDQDWEKCGVIFEITTSELAIFDSAPRYEYLDDQLNFTLDPGKYEILNFRFEPIKDVSLILHRLLYLGGGID